MKRRDYPHGPNGVRLVGHRQYVGGAWADMGLFQLEFLLSQGLRRDQILLDIGCGCLRGGVYLIRYLEAGRYIGVDKEPLLLSAGAVESRKLAHKRPVLIELAGFEFDRLPARPEIAWAHSLFTHLPMEHIRTCMTSLRAALAHGSAFATFFECDAPQANPAEPHDHRLFAYTREEVLGVARATGWRARRIGNCGHPRGQRAWRFD